MKNFLMDKFNVREKKYLIVNNEKVMERMEILE